MAIGNVQHIVVCNPAPFATFIQQAVCPRIGSQYFVPSTAQAYLIAPNQQSNIDAALGPFDYQYAAGVWGFGFSTVVGLYFVSHGIGLVLGMIRRG